jgi:hypothetical protein
MRSARRQLILFIVKLVVYFFIQVVDLEIVVEVISELVIEFVKQVAWLALQPDKFVEVVGIFLVIDAVPVEIVPFLAIVIGDIDFNRVSADNF